jgi:hypothetical protein
MSVAATQHEIAVARVKAHMEIHISDLLGLARVETRPEALGSVPDIEILQVWSNIIPSIDGMGLYPARVAADPTT